jgi:DNA-binding SARP family transcriptional activator
LDIRLLGPLEALEDDGEPLTVNGPVLRSVLAALALRGGQVVAGEDLAGQIWGTELPGSPRATLRNHVGRLRKALPPGRLESVSGGYVLRVGREETDLGRFRGGLMRARALAQEAPAEAVGLLDEALTLWRGEPLAGVGSAVLRGRERPRLLDLRLTSQEERFDLRMALGEHRKILGELMSLARSHPLRVQLAGQLVIALHRCGRTTDAYRELRQAYARLGEAAGELRLLEHELTSRDSSQAPVDLADRLERLASAPEICGRLAASMFSLLGVADVREYNSGSLAALAGCTAREAGQALERLTKARVITEVRTGGYSLGIKERAVAARQAAALPEPRRRGHLAGLARWYLGSLYRINAPLALPSHYRRRHHEGADRFPQGRLFTSADESLPWADQAREEILTLAQQLSVPDYDTGEELAGEPLSSFGLHAVRAMQNYFGIRLSWRIQRRLNEIVLRVGERRGDVFAQAVALGQLGWMHSQRRESVRGLELLERSVVLFRSLGDESEALYTLSWQVPCLGRAGRLMESIAVAEVALAESRRAGLGELAIGVRHNLARSHLLLGHHSQALRLLTEGYALARLPYNRMLSAGVLAEYYLKIKDFEKAAHWADRALAHAAEEPFDPYMVAKQRSRRAAALRGLGLDQQARVEDMQAQALLEDLNRREHSHLRVLPVGEEPHDADAASVQR